MRIIRHKRENLAFHTLNGFMKKVRENYGVSFGNGSFHVEYDEKNRGIFIGSTAEHKQLFRWKELASELGWFDDAEIVTDGNENEKVLTWLNVM